MSQWIVESFVPPGSGKPFPTATWTVPSIFSSNRVFFMYRVMPGLQPMPSSPRRRAPSSRSSVSNQEVLVDVGRRIDDLAALEAQTPVRPLAAGVDHRKFGEDDLTLGRAESVGVLPHSLPLGLPVEQAGAVKEVGECLCPPCLPPAPAPASGTGSRPTAPRGA
jgi:hypothetical protein